MSKVNIKYAVLGAVSGILLAAIYSYVKANQSARATDNPTATSGTDVKQPVF